MKKAVHNLSLMMGHRVGMLAMVASGFIPTIFHIGNPDNHMYFVIAGFMVAIGSFILLKPGYFGVEVAAGGFYVSTDKESVDEFHIQFPADEFLDYRIESSMGGLRKTLYVFRYMPGQGVMKSRGTNISLSTGTQIKALKSMLDSLKQPHNFDLSQL